jgi:hypothetical protein
MHTLQTAEKATSPSRGGGPQTPEGKAQTRLNAVTHGLTATKLLAQILGAEALQRHLHRLTAEFCPATSAEEFLVRELARHAAMLEIAEEAEAAVLRTGAASAANLLCVTGAADENSSAALDQLLTGAVTSEATERLTRYRRTHEKAWHQAHRQLLELRAVARELSSPPPAAPPFAFTEPRCAAYLAERMQTADWRCPSCHHDGGYWIRARRRWQCTQCARQIGVRTGTVMERSPLALSVWFTAIWAILQDPEISHGELAAVAKLPRQATAGRVADRIRAALKAPEASNLVAGLDRVYRTHRINVA